MAKTTATLHIRGFPLDLLQKAKYQALEEGTSQKGIILKALEEYLMKKERGK